jgi:hypothetical protein
VADDSGSGRAARSPATSDGSKIRRSPSHLDGPQYADLAGKPWWLAVVADKTAEGV